MIVTNQKEWDALPASFENFTIIEIQSPADVWLSVITRPTNSHVEAMGSSHVEARGSSHVVARGSSHVEAWGSVSVHVQSECSAVELFGFAVAILLAKCKLTRHTRTCSTVTPKTAKGTGGWLEKEGVGRKSAKVVIFKRVSANFLTQEGSSRETIWSVGLTVVHAHWDPKANECGAGKFHACSRPYFCDEFRSGKRDDRYVAIEVAQKDLYVWPTAQYPHKIAFRQGKVLYECDKFGKKV